MPTAAEAATAAAADMRALNSARYVPTQPALVRDVSAANRIFIFNVGPWAHTRELGSAGTYRIPACPEDKDYSSPVVIEGLVNEPYPENEATCTMLPACGEPRQLRGEGSGLALAKQIIGEGPFIAKRASFVPYGVFISPTPKPSKELLAAARAELEKRHLAHIREANAAFMRDPTNREGVIQPAWHHVSAHALKKSKAECPWLGESLAPAGREECPGCGTPYNVGILKCRDCNYILDKSRYDKAVKEGLFAA